jgi:hypothetical protein
MESLKSLGQGFLFASALIWLFNIAVLIRDGDAWLGLTYLLIMLLPASAIVILKRRGPKHMQTHDASKLRRLLFSFEGVALAFWAFDLLTTFYAINVTGLAVELNPLGWPLGILGALAFYGPTLVFSYVLLFKKKEALCLYAAIPLTILTLTMSSMNLLAGVQNFGVFVDTAALAANLRFQVLAVALGLNLAVPLALRRMYPAPTPELTLKKA